jgi:ribosomal protein L11 methyltransferase
MVTNHMNGIAGGFDVVIANILAAPLIDMAELIAERVNDGCVLALSGILSEQVDQVLEAYRPWIEFDQTVTREQDAQTWARLTGRRIKG